MGKAGPTATVSSPNGNMFETQARLTGGPHLDGGA